MNGVRRITVLTYVLLALAGIIPLFMFPAISVGRLFGNYVFLYLVVAGFTWWVFGSRHPAAMAYTRLLVAAACLACSILVAAWYWAMAR
jgi:hypothetical protein